MASSKLFGEVEEISVTRATDMEGSFTSFARIRGMKGEADSAPPFMPGQLGPDHIVEDLVIASLTISPGFFWQ